MRTLISALLALASAPASADSTIFAPSMTAEASDAISPAITSHPSVGADHGDGDRDLARGSFDRPTKAATLAELVAAQDPSGELPAELRCLATAIYFEAQSESLTGKLAVGRVIVSRTRSSRFPDTYCGVVHQPGQFSFFRERGTPSIEYGSRVWREAVAIALIADSGGWRSPVEGAMFFHAATVSPDWRLQRVARIEHHVFYR